MNDVMSDALRAPRVVDRNTFQAQLDALRMREKAHTREGDAIAAARRRLPMVEADKATPDIRTTSARAEPRRAFSLTPRSKGRDAGDPNRS